MLIPVNVDKNTSDHHFKVFFFWLLFKACQKNPFLVKPQIQSKHYKMKMMP